MSKCKYRDICRYYNSAFELCTKMKPKRRKLICEAYKLFEEYGEWIEKVKKHADSYKRE